MSTYVPPPPLPPQHKEQPPRPTKLKLAAPLDFAFIGRTYLTTLWFGTIATMLAWGVTQSPKATGSFAGGIILGTLLLKSQEVFVRRVLAPRAGVIEDGEALKKELIARVPIALLLPFKYLFIGLLMWIVVDLDWLHPIAFVVGFLTEQVVILSKVLGRYFAGRLKA
jgi:integral membrane sensor domain MASE1